MNFKSKSVLSPRSVLAGAWLGALSLSLVACGGEADANADGDGADQPLPPTTENGSSDPEPGDGSPLGSPLPIDPAANPAGGTSLNLFELLETDECNAGWLPDDPPAGVTCAATFSGACFESDADACSCAGCSDACNVAESFPTQISCSSVPLGGCDYQVFDACFDTAQAACEAAGCELEGCAILESYPAQVRCSE